MVPRRGDSYLDQYHATDAVNAYLYSGELRPLNKPSLAHRFAAPGDPDFVGPNPIVPPPVRPPIPEDCIAPVIISHPQGNEGSGEPCKIYTCDAYSIWAGGGGGEYYWPCTNPTSDGYLAGTVNVPKVGVQYGNLGASLPPDGCVDGEAWYLNWSYGQHYLRLDPSLAIYGSYAVSMVYKNIGGVDDTGMFEMQTYFREYPGSFWGASFGCSLYGHADGRLGVWVQGSNIPTGERVVPNAIPLDGLPHVIGYAVNAPSGSIQGGYVHEYGLTLFVDGRTVGTFIIEQDFTQAPTDVFMVEAPYETGALKFWLPHGSVNAYFSDIAVNGFSDIESEMDLYLESMADAWDRNKADYVDPNPNCGEDVALPGEEVTFSVEVDPSATGPLQYQWYKSGIPLPGETGSTLTFNLELEDDGKYLTVLVLGPCGEELSDAAPIKVDVPK